jgi:hypothetical protein
MQRNRGFVSSRVSSWNGTSPLTRPRLLGPSFSLQYLIIAGGGSGMWTGSGGGAGGMLEGQSPFNSNTTYTATVGAGGPAGVFPADPVNATNSFFGSLIAIAGGSGLTHGALNGNPGGSGGGSPIKTTGPAAGVGGSGVRGQGFRGGNGFIDSGWLGVCGGGGGAGGVGFNAGSTSGTNGQGGPGRVSDITGTEVTYAGGGAGGDVNSSFGTTGGVGGGGRSNADAPGTAGTVNTGSGGGGGGFTGTYWQGGAGGSGIIVLRYSSVLTINLGAGLTGSTATVGADRVTTITAGTGNVSWS